MDIDNMIIDSTTAITMIGNASGINATIQTTLDTVGTLEITPGSVATLDLTLEAATLGTIVTARGDYQATIL